MGGIIVTRENVIEQEEFESPKKKQSDDFFGINN